MTFVCIINHDWWRMFQATCPTPNSSSSSSLQFGLMDNNGGRVEILEYTDSRYQASLQIFNIQSSQQVWKVHTIIMFFLSQWKNRDTESISSKNSKGKKIWTQTMWIQRLHLFKHSASEKTFRVWREGYLFWCLIFAGKGCALCSGTYNALLDFPIDPFFYYYWHAYVRDFCITDTEELLLLLFVFPEVPLSLLEYSCQSALPYG